MNELFKNTEQPYKMVNINSIVPEIEYDSDYCVVKALKRDILANGMLQPLLIRRDKNSIELGNQRYRILKDLNITEVPVRFK